MFVRFVFFHCADRKCATSWFHYQEMKWSTWGYEFSRIAQPLVVTVQVLSVSHQDRKCVSFRPWDQQKAILRHHRTEEPINHHRISSLRNKELIKIMNKQSGLAEMERHTLSRTTLLSLLLWPKLNRGQPERTRDMLRLRVATTECRLFLTRRTARFVRSGYSSSEASNPCGSPPHSPKKNVFSSSIRFVLLVRDGRKLGRDVQVSVSTWVNTELSRQTPFYISLHLYPPPPPFTSCLYCSHLCSSPSLSLSHCADVSLW